MVTAQELFAKWFTSEDDAAVLKQLDEHSGKPHTQGTVEHFLARVETLTGTPWAAPDQVTPSAPRAATPQARNQPADPTTVVAVTTM